MREEHELAISSPAPGPTSCPRTHHVRVLGLIVHSCVGQLNVEVLVDAVKRATNAEVVLQLHSHLAGGHRGTHDARP